MFTPFYFKQKVLDYIPDQLGLYTYPNGYTEPAVGVGNTKGDIDVVGLEVIIPVFGDVRNSMPLIGASSRLYMDQCWKIHFTQRDDDLSNLFVAIDKFTACSVDDWVITGGDYYTQKQAHRTFHHYCLKLKVESVR